MYQVMLQQLALIMNQPPGPGPGRERPAGGLGRTGAVAIRSFRRNN
jgi:hypothetical protein